MFEYAAAARTDAVTDAVRVLLVDAHPLLLDGLLAAAGRHDDLAVVGTSTSGHAGLHAVRTTRVDVAVVGAALPDMTAVEFARTAAAHVPPVGTVVIGQSEDTEWVVRAVEAGADGYLFDDVTGFTVVAAVRAVAAGGGFFDGRAARVLADAIRDGGRRTRTLTAREVVILTHVAGGRSNAEIAALMHLSPSSVKSYLSSAMRKLGARSRTEAVALATRRGLL